MTTRLSYASIFHLLHRWLDTVFVLTHQLVWYAISSIRGSHIRMDTWRCLNNDKSTSALPFLPPGALPMCRNG